MMNPLWQRVAAELASKEARLAGSAAGEQRLNSGQRATLRELAVGLPEHGMMVADEVGMGKTRIAVELVESVVRCGGRVAVLLPAGLGFQWKRELAEGGLAVDGALRSVTGYMDAWDDPDAAAAPHWPARSVVLLSHAFTNGDIRQNADGRRWSLLPAVVATQRNRDDCLRAIKRLPRGGNAAICAARAIVDCLSALSPQEIADWEAFCLGAQWAPLLRPESYAAGGELRARLHRAIGLGLGRFDLVVIDEAHKSRDEDTVLSRLLQHVLWTDPATRFLSLTATPVEMNPAQWLQSLARVRVPDGDGRIARAIERYAAALRQVRLAWRTSDPARAEYAAAAREFESALGRYVLRRDKREDRDVQLYEERAGRSYRDVEHSIEVAPQGLSLHWKRAICAAESLSVSRGGSDMAGKRLRLTLANGHGTMAFLDAGEEALPDASDEKSQAEDQAGALARRQRQAWWRAALRASLRKEEDPLHRHPALLACARRIENFAHADCKVLVFGRYTGPMRALEQLLNAREMLRRLASDRHWPQARVRGADDPRNQWPALHAAYRHWLQEHGTPHPIAPERLDAELQRRYDREQDARETFRRTLVERLQRGLDQLAAGADAGGMGRYRAACAGLRRVAQAEAAGDEGRAVALVARALHNLAGEAREANEAELARMFGELVDATLDQDDREDDAEEAHDADELWAEFEQRLREDYGSQTGGFARLMHGDTKHESRRIIQQAFNRPGSFPMVLIAQSLVGREGLNLHDACRVVVLLHPEWNPAVVEQQIGRVDRVGSLWAQELAHCVAEGVPAVSWPRIEVLPVVLRGTYDDHNWGVLRQRWDDLRAQLHGEVIPPAALPADLTEEEVQFLSELREAAPNFSPARRAHGRR